MAAISAGCIYHVYIGGEPYYKSDAQHWLGRLLDVTLGLSLSDQHMQLLALCLSKFKPCSDILLKKSSSRLQDFLWRLFLSLGLGRSLLGQQLIWGEWNIWCNPVVMLNEVIHFLCCWVECLFLHRLVICILLMACSWGLVKAQCNTGGIWS